MTDGIITLRALEPTDLDSLLRWENDSSLWCVGNTIAPYSRKQLWEYIETYEADIFKSRQLRLMIETADNHQAIGTIDLYDFDPGNQRAFVGILIDSKFGHRGYGSRVLQLIADYARNIIGMHQLVAIVPEHNTHSLRLFNKCGYTPIATLPSWLRFGNTRQNATLFQFILK